MKQPKMEIFTESASLFVTKDMKQRLRVAAAQNGMNQSDYMRALLEANVPPLHPAQNPAPHPNPQPMR